MDPRLSEAARSGNITYLHQLLIESPLLLDTVSIYSTENPLHIASVSGHVDFVKEIVRLKPEFVKEVNEDGFSSMHICAANGHIEIARELIKVDPQVCCLEGRDKKTPLHCAAIKGRAEMINDMLLACPECIQNVTIQGETAIHLAVKNYRFEAIRVFMDWIREMKKEFVLNIKDEQGNSALHLAIWKKQRQVIELFLGIEAIAPGSLDVNAINHSGLAALDMLLIFPSEAGDRETAEILRGAGALRARETNCSQSVFPSFESNPTRSETSQEQANNLVEYFKFKKGRDSSSEARGTLLIITSLVATVTFQVGLSPPGGTWQDNYFLSSQNDNSSMHLAGWSILGTASGVSFVLFVLFNSIGFSLSLYTICFLTAEFPLQLELKICVFAMFFSYNTAMISISPDNVTIFVILITSILSAIGPLLTKRIQRLICRAVKFTVNIIHRVV